MRRRVTRITRQSPENPGDQARRRCQPSAWRRSSRAVDDRQNFNHFEKRGAQILRTAQRDPVDVHHLDESTERREQGCVNSLARIESDGIVDRRPPVTRNASCRCAGTTHERFQRLPAFACTSHGDPVKRTHATCTCICRFVVWPLATSRARARRCSAYGLAPMGTGAIDPDHLSAGCCRMRDGLSGHDAGASWSFAGAVRRAWRM